MSKPRQIDVPIGFTMAEEDGTVKLRVCADHAMKVGQAWAVLARSLYGLADSFDDLTNDDAS